jgi:hypothetical protein
MSSRPRQLELAAAIIDISLSQLLLQSLHRGTMKAVTDHSN